jgi:hypothetical protein
VVATPDGFDRGRLSPAGGVDRCPPGEGGAGRTPGGSVGSGTGLGAGFGFAFDAGAAGVTGGVANGGGGTARPSGAPVLGWDASADR